MRLKTGVKITGLSAELVLALVIIEPVFLNNNVELVITSALEGVHTTGSAHYEGRAVDLRTRDFKNSSVLPDVVHQIRERLGVEFFVLLENDHIHLQLN